jgi:hypothetical protein
VHVLKRSHCEPLCSRSQTQPHHNAVHTCVAAPHRWATAQCRARSGGVCGFNIVNMWPRFRFLPFRDDDTPTRSSTRDRVTCHHCNAHISNMQTTTFSGVYIVARARGAVLRNSQRSHRKDRDRSTEKHACRGVRRGRSNSKPVCVSVRALCPQEHQAHCMTSRSGDYQMMIEKAF